MTQRPGRNPPFISRPHRHDSTLRRLRLIWPFLVTVTLLLAIAGMITLFRHFGGLALMRQAIVHQVQAQCTDSASRHAAMDTIYALNDRMTPLERAFSDTLGRANRMIQHMLLGHEPGERRDELLASIHGQSKLMIGTIDDLLDLTRLQTRTAEQLARVGERFFRANMSGNIPGTGLGVSIVREILHLHGGSLRIDSEAGRGTRVSFFRPGAAQPCQPVSPC